jgi:IS30 family transposase
VATRIEGEHERAAARYFPKGTDLRYVSPDEPRRVAEEINARPRKSLGWARPADLIADAVTSVSA